MVDDDDPSPFFTDLGANEADVKYIRSSSFASVGDKRNVAVTAANGQIIAHFDDDDCYGPLYLTKMVAAILEGHNDLVKLSAWYNFDVTTGVCGHVDYNAPLPYPVCLDRARLRASYGFSLVYRRALAACVPFPNTCWGEDACLVKTASSLGLSLGLVADVEGIVLHTLHRGSSSTLLCQAHVPADAPQRHPSSFLRSAIKRLTETGALGPGPLEAAPGEPVRPHGLFCWDIHAVRRFWVEDVPRQGEGEACEEFTEWLEWQARLEAGDGDTDRPEGLRRELAKRRSAERDGRAPLTTPGRLPAGAIAAMSALGLPRTPQGSRAPPAPLPLWWHEHDSCDGSSS